VAQLYHLASRTYKILQTYKIWSHPYRYIEGEEEEEVWEGGGEGKEGEEEDEETEGEE
jgi:hypothetical protein